MEIKTETQLKAAAEAETEIQPGVYLQTGAALAEEQKSLDAGDSAKGYSFGKAPYFLVTDTGEVLPVSDVEDLNAALGKSDE